MASFWQGIRKAASSVYHGLFSGKDATPVQRAWATGHTTGYQIANTYSQLSHNTSWNWVATHAVGKQWAQASYVVFDDSQQVQNRYKTKGMAQDGPAEQRTPVKDHPIIKLLDRPNPLMSHEEWMYQASNQLRLTGGVVIWEVRSKEDGKPCELWILPRAWLTMMPPTDEYPLGVWRVVNPRGMMGHFGGGNNFAGGFWLDVRDTINIKYPHPLYPGEPFSPLEACSQIIDIGEKADSATLASLINSVRPGIILNVDPKVQLGPDQIREIERQLAELKGGVDNSGKSLVLQGVTKDSLGTPMSDLNSTEVRRQSMEFMLGVQGVPNLLAGIRNDVGSYSGDAATINTCSELNIQPDLDLFAAGLNHRFDRYWPGSEIELHAVRMDDPLLKQHNADQIFQAIDKGAASINEWRATQDLPPIPGGDEYTKPQPPAMPGQAPGMPGDDAASPFDNLDLDDDLADEDGPGNVRPELQQAFDNLPPFLMNGSANGVPH